jgi:hypothetical protein
MTRLCPGRATPWRARITRMGKQRFFLIRDIRVIRGSFQHFNDSNLFPASARGRASIFARLRRDRPPWRAIFGFPVSALERATPRRADFEFRVSNFQNASLLSVSGRRGDTDSPWRDIRGIGGMCFRTSHLLLAELRAAKLRSTFPCLPFKFESSSASFGVALVLSRRCPHPRHLARYFLNNCL